MAMYALATKPLIRKLRLDIPNVRQVWYADDATGAGTCEDLREFWSSLQAHGNNYGYHPNTAKTDLVVAKRGVCWEGTRTICQELTSPLKAIDI